MPRRNAHSADTAPSSFLSRTALCVLVCALAFWALPSGCARVTHRPLPFGDDYADRIADGIRYYPSALYLLVYSDGDGGIVSKIIELPDTTKPMLAKPRVVLANIDVTLDFRDGVLTSAGESPDSTALPEAVIRAIEGVARHAGVLFSGGSSVGPSEHVVPPPCLYKIVVHTDSVEFIGGAGDEPVHISLRPEEAP